MFTGLCATGAASPQDTKDAGESSPGLGSFIMAGKIESDGTVMLSAGINPVNGNALFIGQVGPDRETLSGNWQFTGDRQGNGTFVAQLRR